jgi:hypothetical protein
MDVPFLSGYAIFRDVFAAEHIPEIVAKEVAEKNHMFGE